MCFWPFSKCQLDFILQVKNVCVATVGHVMLVVLSCLWEKNVDIHYPCIWLWGCSEQRGTQWSPSIFFFFFVLICMEFLTTETVSNTLSLKLFKQFKPVCTTPSCCGRGKPQISGQKEKWTTSQCPDWAGHCFSPSDALQKSSGYQQFTTFLVDFRDILEEYNSFFGKKKPE